MQSLIVQTSQGGSLCGPAGELPSTEVELFTVNQHAQGNTASSMTEHKSLTKPSELELNLLEDITPKFLKNYLYG